MKKLLYILFFFPLSGFSNEELPPMYDYALGRAIAEDRHVAEIYLEMFEVGAINDLPDCIGSANLWLNDFGQPYYATRYVAAGASGSGTSIGAPMSLSASIAAHNAGDIIWVDAGNYGASNFSVSRSGSSGSPVQYFGYKDTPGDIVSSNGSTFVHGVSTYSTADYPTFVGSRTSHSGSGASVSGGNVTGDAFTITASYVEFHNFQVRNKNRAFYVFGDHVKIINSIIHDIGNYSGYSGFSIASFGEFTTVNNSYLRNPGVQAITIGSDPNNASFAEVHYNYVRCDQTIGNDWSTDYYILGTGLYDSNFSNNTVHRAPGQYHQGHGIIIKSTGARNTFMDNIIQNTCIELSFEGVNNNTIRGGTVEATVDDDPGQNPHYAFVMVANGAHDNLFENITFRKDVMVRFQDWDDGYNPTPNTDIVSAGYDNVFRNFIGIDIKEAIQFGWQWYGAGVAENNVFDHWTIDGLSDAFIRAERANTGTILRNSVIMNASATVYNENNDNPTQVRPVSTQYAANITYVNCYFFNINFTVPGVTEAVADPLFTNAGAEDYTLQAGSPLRDAGSSATSGTLDFAGETRDASPDIGAFKYAASGPVAVTGVKVTPSSITTNGTTAQFYKIVFPLTADDQTGTWSSDNGSASTVNSSGLATEVADGQADIQFETTDGDFTDTGSVTFSDSYVPDAFEVIGPLLYLQPNSVDPDVTVDASPTSIWEDMSGNGLNAFPQGDIDLNLDGSDRSAEHSGTSYWLLPDDSSLNLVPGTDEIYIAVREGPVSTSGTGYMISKAGASDRQFGISYSGGELEGAYVGGVFNAFSGVPTGTRRFVELIATTTTVSARVDGIYVLVDAAIGTATNPGQPWNIGGRTNGSYLVTAGAQFDLVVIDDELPDAGELEDIQEQFNVNSAPDPGEENITIRGIYLSTSKSGGLYLGSTRLSY